MVRSSVAGVVVASLAVLALAGCTTASPASAPRNTSTPPSSATPATSKATYTPDDLVAILTSTKKTLGSDGSILDDAHLKKAAANTGGVSALLSEKGVT